MRSSHFLTATFSIALSLLLVRPATAAVSRPDTTITMIQIVTDTKDQFRANGTWTSIDRSVPPDLFGYQIYFEVRGTNWLFLLLEESESWRIPNTLVDNGARRVTVSLDGEHTDGPHDPPGPPVDDDPNLLTPFTTDPKDNLFKLGVFSISTKTARKAHPTNMGNHWDIYGIKRKFTATEGPDHFISGPWEINAKHTDDRKITWVPFALVMGSSSGAGSRVSFDSGTGSLTIHMGTIDILNGIGSLAVGIEPEFQSDPLRSCEFSDLTLPYLGLSVDFAHRFGPGGASLFDPESNLSLEGDIPEILLRDSSRSGVMDSDGLFEVFEIADTGTCPSLFLGEFADRNILGKSALPEEWGQVDGLSLALVTDQNLAQLTADFTLSAFNIPATVALTSRRSVDFPSSVEDGPTGDAPVWIRTGPNPFTSQTTIHYRVAQPDAVTIDVFDVAGRHVRRLVDQIRRDAGTFSADWDGEGDHGEMLPAGSYFFRVAIGSRIWTEQVIRLK